VGINNVTNYPNDRRNAAGAVPVYVVAPPTNPPWPNAQNNPNGAIPVNFVAAPTTANAGAIPVRIVAGSGPGPKFPNDQGNDAGAIPVYDDADGMPVWAAAGLPPPGSLPVNITLPSITPTGIQSSGTTLTANPGIWTNSPTTYLYQWTRNSANIAGATANTYVLVIADRNMTISVTVTAQNTWGDSDPYNSSNTIQVLGVPVNVISPSISPIGPVDVGTGLSVNPGTWTNQPTGYFYSWRRDAVAISGASMNIYGTVDVDADTIIDCVLLATNAVGSGNAVPTSNQVAVNPLP
jgi:hypothetical protein